MKRKNKQNWLLLVALATFGAIVACTADDDIWGLDDERETSFSGKTRAVLSDTMDYLSISTYNSEEWTDSDFEIVGEAIQRIGVTFSESKNKYVFEYNDGSDINMSDSLYDVVVGMFEHTNSIMNAKQKKISRKKVKTGDISSQLPDCVPAAISNMGKNAPSYDAAIAKCNELFPTWKTDGGVPTDKIESFIEVYAAVTARTNMNFCKTDSTLNNLVMVFQPGTNGHAVNAYKYYSTPGVIMYHDASSSSRGDGSIIVSQMLCIYTFD